MVVNIIKCLLIDDDEDDFFNIKDLMKDIKGHQYQLDWKHSYDAGLQALRDTRYDVCLLDHRLGARTGLDLLRELEGSLKDCPIILLTGYGDFELDVLAMQTGASDYLVKEQLTVPLLERSIRYSMKHAFDLKELRERQESFMTLFNSTFEGILVLKDGVISNANQGAAKIFGSNHENLIYKPIHNYIHPNFRKDFEHYFINSEQSFETLGLREDGSEVQIELTKRIILIKGEATDLIAIRDLTQRKEMETQILQQDRLASLGLLASSLAHEIGTPLGIIRGRSELIIRKIVGDEPLKNDITLIISQIDRITKLMNSLLHLARGDSSKHTIAVDIKNVVEDILNLLSHELARKDIRLSIEIENPSIVKAESGPLGQVLLNLLVNSVHAIEEMIKNGISKKHTITIRTQNQTQNQIPMTKIIIHDTGCGISEKNMTQLFKPFFTTKDIGHGTGLGLATSYKLIQSWGGSIQAESKPNGGASFIINLPSVPS